VAEQLWFMTHIREEEEVVNLNAVAMFTPSRKKSWSAVFTPMCPVTEAKV